MWSAKRLSQTWSLSSLVTLCGVVLASSCAEPQSKVEPAKDEANIAGPATEIDEAEAIRIAKQFLDERYGPGHYIEFDARHNERSGQWLVLAKVPQGDQVYSQGTMVIIDRNGNARVSPGR